MRRRLVIWVLLTVTAFTFSETAVGAWETNAPVWTVSVEQGYSYDPDMSLQIAYEFLMNTMELNRAVASGIIANFIAESGIRTTALGDGGTSYGLCQWHNERWASLISFSESYGKPMEDIDTQLMFFKEEVMNGYEDLYRFFLTLPDNDDGAYKAAYRMCLDYECPAAGETAALARGNIGISTLEKEYTEYEYSLPVMEILYMLTVYENNYTPPVVKFGGETVTPEAQDTYIPESADIAMSYDGNYWEYIEGKEYLNPWPEWLQPEDVDNLDRMEIQTYPEDVQNEELQNGEKQDQNDMIPATNLPEETDTEEKPDAIPGEIDINNNGMEEADIEDENLTEDEQAAFP